MLPATNQRVAAHTPQSINDRIRRRTEADIIYYANRPDEIDSRLEDLDREWDVERVLEANAATLALSGVLLGAVADRRWLFLPAAVTAFLLQHAVQGWCPPIPIIRRLGVRTAAEIAEERYALKALRGDFRINPSDSDPATYAREAHAAARA